MFSDEEKKPNVIDAKTVGLALAAHLVLFAALFFVGQLASKPKETVIPIDLTVVVHENLDGKENEPPPEKEVAAPEPAPKPAPEPPPPPPEPAPEPEPRVEAVEQIVAPKKETPKKVQPKPRPPKETPPQPQKTKEQLARERKRAREERLKAIRAAVKKGTPPRNAGKTDKRPTNWRELLNQGYRPAATTQVAADENQRCYSLIRNAFYAKWNSPPWTDTLGDMLLAVEFGPGGQVKSYRLVKSSGDRAADNSVLEAAAQVRRVAGLSYEFLSKNPSVTVRFKVKPN